ncbi:MAG TPA: hypothetical protein VGD64_14215 [Acidisarcina sp.]
MPCRKPVRPSSFTPLLIAALFLAPATARPIHAQGTKLWTQSTFEEFEKGHAQGVAIRSDGAIEAGPKLTSLLSTPSTYVWSIASDRGGNTYVATGAPATVLKVAPDGKSTKIFETKDLSVQVVRIGADGVLYVATLPSAKVYRIKPDGPPVNDTTATLVFDPSTTDAKPKYVWDLAFDAAGKVYIATGGPAAVYRIDLAHPVSAPKAPARPELFFNSDEQHIRCLAFDPAGNLIAGSDGTGLIYRIDPAGKGFVLYDTPRHEITAVAIAPNGAIYASAVGEKNRSSLPPLPVQGITVVTANITVVQPGSVLAFNGNTVIPDGSELYELAPNAAPRKLWAPHDDIVYALRWTPAGLLAATGNRGRIYRIQENGDFADVGHVEASQGTGFADAPGGFYLGTSNTGKVYTLTTANEEHATYTSNVFDAGLFARWGRAEVDGSGASDLFARSGNIENPERAWSDWQPVAANKGGLGVPAARFTQWKAVLHPAAKIRKVGVNYLPVNAAPVIDDIAVQPGARVTSQPSQPSQQQTINITFASVPANNFSFSDNSGTGPLAALRDKSAVTVRWAAHDDNGDELTFAVYFRAEGDTAWRVLKDKLTERFYSFDAALLPDGRYEARVVASDAPSHNPGEALTAEKVSDHFLIDTTAPVLSNLKAVLADQKVHITVDAIDASSPIAHAEYSVDAGPWQYIEPVGGLSDSPTEHYDFVAPLDPDHDKPASSQEHLVTVRVYDRYENVATAKTSAAIAKPR